jgi:RNA-binding protein NOB1
VSFAALHGNLVVVGCLPLATDISMSTWASLLRNSAPIAAAEPDLSPVSQYPVILDANALIRGDINYIRTLGADDVITLPAILAEVRDKVSREMLASWPVKPNEMNPDAASIEFVEAFAKLTGDITTLSRQDIRVLALAVMLERRINGGRNLRDKPQVNVLKRMPFSECDAAAVAGGQAAAAVGADEDWGEVADVEDDLNDEDGVVAGSGGEDSCSGSSSADPGEQDEGETELALLNSELAALDADLAQLHVATGSAAVHSPVPAHGDEDTVDDGGEWEVVTRKRDPAVAHRDSSSKATALPGWYHGDDDEAGWIGPTPANASSAAAQRSSVVDQFQGVADEQVCASAAEASHDSSEAAVLPTSPCVRVVTADFAMQNVLLQMGIQVVGTGGRMVKGVKTFVLKCHSCFKICMDASREFCPHCGNHTMMKVRCGSVCFTVFAAPALPLV